MRIKSECIACVLRQCAEAGRLAGREESAILEAVKEASRLIPSFTLRDTPMSVTLFMHRLMREILGIDDPYREVKRKFNEQGRSAYPYLRRLLEESENPLETAVRIAVAGNIVDYALPLERDLEKSLQEALKVPLPSEEWRIFEEQVSKSRKILYLLDNAGEIFFDKVLIEHLLNKGKEIVVGVRGGPALNDVTIEDAEEAGLTKLTKVVSTEIDTVGFILEMAGEEFRRELDSAELVIAKGQANLESLDETEYPAFFLLKAKCPIIAELMGVKVGEVIFQANRRNPLFSSLLINKG